MAKVVRQNLHVPGKHREIDLLVLHYGQDSFFYRRLAQRIDIKVVKRQLVLGREALGLPPVIGENAMNVDGKFSAAVSLQQICQAVGRLGRQNQNARSLFFCMELALHIEAICDWRKRLKQAFGGFRIIGHNEGNPHKKAVRNLIIVLSAFRDVGVALEQEF